MYVCVCIYIYIYIEREREIYMYMCVPRKRIAEVWLSSAIGRVRLSEGGPFRRYANTCVPIFKSPQATC